MTENDQRRQVQLRTFMDLSVHFILTVLLAWFFYSITNGWLWPVLCFLGGIFIDLDHFIDYFRYSGRKFDFKDFFSHKQLTFGRVYLYFHSWELIFLLWLMSWRVFWIIPLVSGMTLHLTVDQFAFHTAKPLFYFLIYRLYHSFRLSDLDPLAYRNQKEETARDQ